MAWTDPTTRSPGDLITATIWNEDVVDNLDFLHDRVVQIFCPPLNPSVWVLTGDVMTAQMGALPSLSSLDRRIRTRRIPKETEASPPRLSPP